MKKLLCILIACFTALALVACGGGSQSGGTAEAVETVDEASMVVYAPSDTESIAVGSFLEPVGLDINAVTYLGILTTGRYLYDPLLLWDDENKVAKPNVITEWNVVDNYTIDITIRDDIYSHNGYLITTEDVLYTFKRVKETPAIASYAEAIDVDNCILTDDTHMTIKLINPSPDQIMYFTSPCLSVTSKEGLEACGGHEANNVNPVACTGPYKFVEWVHGSYMKLERNEDWWGTKPYYKYVEIRFISDGASRLMALQSGDIQAAEQLATLQIQTIESDPNLTLVEHTGTTFYYMCLNNKKEPFNNVKVRQAINMAVDRELVLNMLFDGHGDVMDNILPKSASRYSAPASGTEWVYDVEQAKALMKEAGYENGFDMTVLTTSEQFCVDIAEYLTGALAEIGINVTVEMAESTSLSVKQSSGDFEAFIYANPGVHGDTGTIKMYDDRYDYADGSFCQFHAQDADAFYELLDTFYVTADIEESRALTAEIMDVLRDEVPTIAFVNNTEVAATRGVTGIKFVNGNVDLTMLRPNNMLAPEE